MNNCAEKQSNLKAYLDGELGPIERLAMGSHLLRCPRCREARAAMMEISRRIVPGEAEPLPPALRARILDSVSYAAPRPAAPASASRHTRRVPLFLLGGATAAGLVVVALMNPGALRGVMTSSAPNGPSTVEMVRKSAKQAAAPNAFGGAPAVVAPQSYGGGAPAANGGARPESYNGAASDANGSAVSEATGRAASAAAARKPAAPGGVEERRLAAPESEPAADKAEMTKSASAVAVPRGSTYSTDLDSGSKHQVKAPSAPAMSVVGNRSRFQKQSAKVRIKSGRRASVSRPRIPAMARPLAGHAASQAGRRSRTAGSGSGAKQRELPSARTAPTP